MRRFRRAFGRSPGKRSVAWIPGFSAYDDPGGAFSRLMTLAGPIPGSTSTWGAAVQLTVDQDLQLHGGEDAVFQRLRGTFFFVEGRRNTGAGNVATSFPLRVVVYQCEILPGGTFNNVFTTSAGLGDDDILWTGEVLVSSVPQGATFTGLDTATVRSGAHYLDIDVRAKRKLSSNRQLVMAFQTSIGGTTGLDFRLLGGVRMLLKRPR